MKMSRIRTLVGALFVSWSMAGQAAELPISVGNASGSPGAQIVLELQVDFGPSFEMMTQNLKFEYDPGVLAFSADDSSVVAGPTTTSWSAYFNQLVALSNSSFTTQNFNAQTGDPGRKGYSLDFMGASGTLERVGIVRYNLAFDIDPAAQVGTTTQVTFRNSAFSDGNDEFFFPDALNSPGVTVSVVSVPEPSQALLLLAGLGLLALGSSRARSWF